MFQIVVDSAANIPAEIVKKYNIKVISFVNYINDKPLVCFDPELTQEEERAKGKEYYDAMRSGIDIKTGLISSGNFEEYFKAIMEAGEDVLYFSLSKNISGTFNSARLAAENLMEDTPNGRKIKLIDSLNASLGQGILAIYASEMREKGMDIDAVYEELLAYPEKMNGVFHKGCFLSAGYIQTFLTSIPRFNQIIRKNMLTTGYRHCKTCICTPLSFLPF